ncbi:MAG TPA: ribosome biogenesis GTP-binding protein YihA/YsxC [Syntrophomonadaceae bacterium]|nr:ribosome biogenesis GTP-binding protein YihA/YsxC [Syntrophomonadaceae bacterium]
MIVIKKAEFIASFVNFDQLPEGNLPEIALVGRSNVGKSSLINKVLNRKNLAKSSSTPGKTRTINYYLINDQWYFVDLPGYGYAKVSKMEKRKWATMIETYLSEREQLKGVIQLIDIRHSPTDSDVLMKDWLMNIELPILVVATKVDKISRGAKNKHLAVARKGLHMEPGTSPILFSAETGEGVGEIHKALEEIVVE